MLKLICGPSGSGKTAQIYEQIQNDVKNGIRTFLLVPEQQAYISERDLLGMLPENAGLFFEVVNFSGLAEDVFRTYGGVTQLHADSGTRALLMWETLRALSGSLKQYRIGMRSDLSLTAEMLHTVEELKRNGITADQLEQAVIKMPENHALRQKLSDFAAVLAVYNDFLQSNFGGDQADLLLRMAELLRGHRFFSGCRIYLDSFTDFTNPEYAVLQEILQQADRVTVSLCADRTSSHPAHFATSLETAKRLRAIAKRFSLPVEEEYLDNRSNRRPDALRILERELWNFGFSQDPAFQPTKEKTSCVHFLTASNLYEESEAVAIQILGLVQNGYRYGDLAVVVRDLETYRGVLDAALERHGIPFFLSERVDFLSKPISRLVLSALRAVGCNYRSQDMMTLLKTGLCGVEQRDAALFEEYCETWHITGSRFRDRVWNMNPDGLTTDRSPRANEILDAANRVRQIVMEPLEKLEADLKTSEKLPDRCRALYDYLNRLQLPAQLSDRAKDELRLGARRQANETVRLYTTLIGKLAELCELLPDTTLSIDDFSSVLTILFSNTDLGSVPDVRDCVILGSADTLRVENIKISFLMGLCEGEFPKAVRESGLLTENDKEMLEEYDFIFHTNIKKYANDELFYVYRSVTKPLEQLYLSMPMQKTDGTPNTPSLAFTRAKFLLGGDDCKVVSFDADALEMRSGSSGTESGEPLKLPEKPSGTRLRLSTTAIEQYAGCPYRYFSERQLKIRGNKDANPNAMDDGNFMHFVFEQFLRASVGEDGSLHFPPDEELEPIADQIIDGYLRAVYPAEPEEMDAGLLHLLYRLRKLAILMLRNIIAEIQVGSFVPSQFEQQIGGKRENALPEVVLQLENGSSISLGGKVDRVDLYKAPDGKVYFRVIDYKSGNHVFKLEEVKSGTDIQLVLYLLAVANANPEAIPAGANFIALNHSASKPWEIVRSGFILDDAAIMQAADRSGAYSAKLKKQSREEMSGLVEQMKTVVCEIGGRILNGYAEKNPSSKACNSCSIQDHCDCAIRSKDF